MSKIAMVPCWSSRRSTSCFLGCAISSPTASTTAPTCVTPSPNSVTGPLRSSSAPLTLPAFNCCPAAGWSNEPSPGSIETAVWPRISRLLGGVHLGTNQQTAGIGHNVALAAFDLLGRIVPPRPTALGGLGRLTVDDPGRRARFTARRFACLQQQRKIDLLKQAVVSPIVEIALHRGERGKVLGQHPPLTAGPRDVQDRVQHGSQLGVARPAQRLGRRHMGLDQRPFRIRDIACVALSLSLILWPGDFGPHLVPR